MNTYLSIPARYLMGRKLRSFLTTLAVVFGVAVVFAVNMLLPTLISALTASQMGVTGQVDMTVTSASGNPFPADVVKTVEPAEGVAAVAPAYERPVTLPASTNVPPFDLVGLDPTRAETVRYYQVTAGRFLNASDTDAAVVSQQLAQAIGVHAGDTFKLPTADGVVDFSVVGVFPGHAGDQMLVPLQTAQRIYHGEGQITAADVVIIAGADRDTVKKALQDKLGSTFSVGSLEASNAFSQTIQLGLVIFNRAAAPGGVGAARGDRCDNRSHLWLLARRGIGGRDAIDA